jgi:hypothetical protein
MNASSVKFNFIGLTTTLRQPLNELIREDRGILNRKKVTDDVYRRVAWQRWPI